MSDNNYVIADLFTGNYVSKDRLMTENLEEAMSWKDENVAEYYLSEYIQESSVQKLKVVNKISYNTV